MIAVRHQTPRCETMNNKCTRMNGPWPAFKPRLCRWGWILPITVTIFVRVERHLEQDPWQSPEPRVRLEQHHPPRHQPHRHQQQQQRQQQQQPPPPTPLFRMIPHSLHHRIEVGMAKPTAVPDLNWRCPICRLCEDISGVLGIREFHGRIIPPNARIKKR
jgi:hypothetical protein